ncbi:MAG: septum formation initiator family protein [Acidobacteriota bacterium]
MIWGVVVFATVTLTRALVGEKGLLAVWQHRREVASVEHEIGRLKVQNENLRDEIQSLRKDPRAVEGVAREELGLVHPDEFLILLPRQDAR